MIDHRSIAITTIAENTSTGVGILGEWGLSVLITVGDRRFLLDAGSSDSTVSNADAMGVDLKGIEAIVLSHGHNDHTGGLPAVLRRTGPTRLVAHPAALEPKFGSPKASGAYRYTGMTVRREALEGLGARVELSASPTWLTEDVAASGVEPMSTDFEKVSPSLLVKRGDRYEPDPMEDDQSLYLRTDLGLVVVLGCAHRGAINIIRHARELMGTKEVYLVLGGTHLGPVAEKQVSATIAALREMDVKRLGLSHCTGLRVASRFAAEFPDRFFFNNAGSVVRLPVA